MGHFIFILFIYYYLVWLWVLCFPSLLLVFAHLCASMGWTVSECLWNLSISSQHITYINHIYFFLLLYLSVGNLNIFIFHIFRFILTVIFISHQRTKESQRKQQEYFYLLISHLLISIIKVCFAIFSTSHLLIY